MNRSEIIRKRKEKVLLFLFGLYVILFLLSNILSVKIVDFKFFETSFSILLVPFLFLITDIVCEVFDYEKSKNFYFFSIIFLFLSSIIIFTALKLPLASRAFISQEQFEAVFKQTIRIFLASIIAFSISQLNDIFIFSKLKKLHKNKKLWFRNNLSTIISQFLDSIIFLLIAFLYVSSKFTFSFIFTNMFLPYYILKVILALFDTPLFYLSVKYIKKYINLDFTKKSK